jgi:hypothetical protein
VAYSKQFCIILPNHSKGPLPNPFSAELPEAHTGCGGLQGSLALICGLLSSQHFAIFILKS